jgi:hypothetical protein
VGAVTRAELEGLGWTDAKLDTLYVTHVKDVSSIDKLAHRVDGRELYAIRRERFNAVCAKLYASAISVAPLTT